MTSFTTSTIHVASVQSQLSTPMVMPADASTSISSLGLNLNLSLSLDAPVRAVVGILSITLWGWGRSWLDGWCWVVVVLSVVAVVTVLAVVSTLLDELCLWLWCSLGLSFWFTLVRSVVGTVGDVSVFIAPPVKSTKIHAQTVGPRQVHRGKTYYLP